MSFGPWVPGSCWLLGYAGVGGSAALCGCEARVSRLLSDDLILSYVPDMEQRSWRTLTRTKYQLTRDRVRLQSQLESLLEECQIKLSSVVSDLVADACWARSQPAKRILHG